MHDILGIETGPKLWLMPDERYSRSHRLMLVVTYEGSLPRACAV